MNRYTLALLFGVVSLAELTSANQAYYESGYYRNHLQQKAASSSSKKPTTTPTVNTTNYFPTKFASPDGKMTDMFTLGGMPVALTFEPESAISVFNN